MTTGLGTVVPWLSPGTTRCLSSFDTNMGIFLKEHGQPVQLPSLPDVSCWVVALSGTQTALELHIYKERLGDSTSAVCDHCRIIGNRTSLCCSFMHEFSITRHIMFSGVQAGRTILFQVTNTILLSLCVRESLLLHTLLKNLQLFQHQKVNAAHTSHVNSTPAV